MRDLLQSFLDQLQTQLYNPKYDSPESFLHLPFDDEIQKAVATAIKTSGVQKELLKCIVVIGIGGSCWGPKAVYDSIKGLKKNKDIPKMYFLDQIDPDKIQFLAQELQEYSPQQAILVNISKSGATAETIINDKLLKEALSKGGKSKNFPEFIIRGENSVKNALIAKTEKEHILTLPEAVGGRFSTFSAVGLLPLDLVGIDTQSWRQGGQDATADFLSHPENLTQKALSIFEQYQHGKIVYNLFVFSQDLISLAEWEKQLIGESLGKNQKGILPMISTGSRDLHSLQQFFVGGKPIVQHEFLSIKNKNPFQDIIKKAVLKTYQEKSIPFWEEALEEQKEYFVGKYMQAKFLEVLLLAKLMEVNPFGQPDVESYKQGLESLLLQVIP